MRREGCLSDSHSTEQSVRLSEWEHDTQLTRRHFKVTVAPSQNYITPA